MTEVSVSNFAAECTQNHNILHLSPTDIQRPESGANGTSGGNGEIAYGFVTDDGLNGLPYVLYGFVMLDGLYGLPYGPYRLLVLSGAYGLVESRPRYGLTICGAWVA